MFLQTFVPQYDGRFSGCLVLDRLSSTNSLKALGEDFLM